MYSEKENTKNEDGRVFHAWACVTVRHARPAGKKQREGCGKWSVKASKHRLGMTSHLQANCPHCGRRARLNRATRKVYTYETRDAALTHCKALNEHDNANNQTSGVVC